MLFGKAKLIIYIVFYTAEWSSFLAIIERKGRALKPAQLSVLVIDDQPFYCNLLNEILRAMGVSRIETAENGRAAFEVLQSFMPNIIICDWVMPEMNGLEFAKKIRNSSNNILRQVPIIMITSNNLRSQIIEARNAGVDTFVLKPISNKSVWDRLKEVVETPRDFIEVDNYIGPCRRAKKQPQDFYGPYRRHDDPMELSIGIAAETRAKNQMNVIAKKLHQLVAMLKSGKKEALTELSSATHEVMSIAREVDDQQLAKICWSLNTYVDKCNEANILRIDVVAAHIQSMEVLINTPLSQVQMRDILVKELHGVVMKSLRAA